ncbi:MAG TPA: glycosidase [Rhodospirillales bacterium]|nr:glycosidase [Rhodospirillales bacterium]
MKVKTFSPIAKRKSVTLLADNSRVITRPYIPGPDNRIKNVVARVLGLSDDEVKALLERVLRDFSGRHRRFEDALEKNYLKIEHCVPNKDSITREMRLLLGSYFTCEYSIEAAALFNPSIVLHPDQKDLPEGSARFIMSFRATGEGHISSIEFWSGRIDGDGNITFDPTSNYVETPELQTDKTYDKHHFNLKLNEMGETDEEVSQVLGGLDDKFTFEQLQEKIAEIQSAPGFNPNRESFAIDMAMWLARSNYEIKFRENHSISERVIFPASENESKGIEDARFVRFTDGDDVRYYAPYTAYDGFVILPQMIMTKDFITFKINTLNGKAVQNKGMALFPRKIRDKYVMLSRQDGENNRIMFSDNIYFWQDSEIFQTPTHPWEFVQIGNCGSPVETSEGWLLLTHGVGAMRRYGIGLELLDLDDPTKVIGRLDEPILVPTDGDREGYVPNVVYSCGVLMHKDELIIPYAVADQRTSIATFSVPEILSQMSRPA